MTHERDIDRLLDLWILDGPTQVADRVILDVAARIDRQPQRPAWRFLRRPTPMTSSVRWAVVLVAVALIAVVGFVVIGRRPSDSDISASPTPTVESSPTSSSATMMPDTPQSPAGSVQTRLLSPRSCSGRRIARSSTSSKPWPFSPIRRLGSIPEARPFAPAGPDRITFTSSYATMTPARRVTSVLYAWSLSARAARIAHPRGDQRTTAQRAWSPCPARGRVVMLREIWSVDDNYRSASRSRLANRGPKLLEYSIRPAWRLVRGFRR